MTDHPRAAEQRTIDVNVENLDTRGRTLHGYAAVYGVESGDLGGFRERIAPGAFAQVLDADVRCLLNHDPNEVLGRTRSGTLRLADEQRGLRFECDLPDSPLGENVRASVKRGDIDGASFRFVVGTEDWEGDIRTVKTVSELQDVTVATYAAYPAASVELRVRPGVPPAGAVTSVTASHEPAERENQETTDMQVEDRTAAAAEAPIEDRVRDALFSIQRGESRSLTTTSAGAIAPPELSTYVFDRLRASSVALASGIQVIATDRDQITWPRITADVATAFYNEGQAFTPADPTLVSLTATPRKLGALVQFSNEVIDDSVPAVVDVMNAHVSTILGLRLDLAIFEGTGTAPEITGLKNIAGINTVSMGTNGAAPTSLDPISDALGTLEAANAKPGAIVMHPRTWNELRKLKATTGEYLLEDEPLTVADPAALRLFGVPVHLTSQIATTEAQGTATTASSIYVYDPGQVVLVRRNDAVIELDRSRLFNQDMSELRGKIRATVVVPNPGAVCRITGVL